MDTSSPSSNRHFEISSEGGNSNEKSANSENERRKTAPRIMEEAQRNQIDKNHDNTASMLTDIGPSTSSESFTPPSTSLRKANNYRRDIRQERGCVILPGTDDDDDADIHSHGSDCSDDPESLVQQNRSSHQNHENDKTPAADDGSGAKKQRKRSSSLSLSPWWQHQLTTRPSLTDSCSPPHCYHHHDHRTYQAENWTNESPELPSPRPTKKMKHKGTSEKNRSTNEDEKAPPDMARRLFAANDGCDAVLRELSTSILMASASSSSSLSSTPMSVQHEQQQHYRRHPMPNPVEFPSVGGAPSSQVGGTLHPAPNGTENQLSPPPPPPLAAAASRRTIDATCTCAGPPATIPVCLTFTMAKDAKRASTLTVDRASSLAPADSRNQSAAPRSNEDDINDVQVADVEHNTKSIPLGTSAVQKGKPEIFKQAHDVDVDVNNNGPARHNDAEDASNANNVTAISPVDTFPPFYSQFRLTKEKDVETSDCAVNRAPSRAGAGQNHRVPTAAVHPNHALAHGANNMHDPALSSVAPRHAAFRKKSVLDDVGTDELLVHLASAEQEAIMLSAQYHGMLLDYSLRAGQLRQLAKTASSSQMIISSVTNGYFRHIQKLHPLARRLAQLEAFYFDVLRHLQQRRVPEASAQGQYPLSSAGCQYGSSAT